MDCEISKICTLITDNITKIERGEAGRLLHGRGGTYKECPYLNADFFPPVVFVTLYEKREEGWKKELAGHVLQRDDVETVVFQNRIKAPWTNELYGGELPESHVVKENGLSYSVSLERGENPGIFPDMKEGRSYLRSISSGKRVLNLFSYTCAFSVVAAAGGAKSVLNMDMNSNSLSRGRLNHQLNQQKCDISYLSHNILKSFGKITKRGPFDLVVIDPPPSQGSSFNLERDYGKILRRCRDFLVCGGELLVCLNSHNYDFKWFEAFIEKNLGECSIVRKMGAGDRFPESDPDLGLKIIHLKTR